MLEAIQKPGYIECATRFHLLLKNLDFYAHQKYSVPQLSSWTLSRFSWSNSQTRERDLLALQKLQYRIIIIRWIRHDFTFNWIFHRVAYFPSCWKISVLFLWQHPLISATAMLFTFVVVIIHFVIYNYFVFKFSYNSNRITINDNLKSRKFYWVDTRTICKLYKIGLIQFIINPISKRQKFKTHNLKLYTEQSHHEKMLILISSLPIIIFIATFLSWEKNTSNIQTNSAALHSSLH